jgi:hypothetical protein
MWWSRYQSWLCAWDLKVTFKAAGIVISNAISFDICQAMLAANLSQHYTLRCDCQCWQHNLWQVLQQWVHALCDSGMCAKHFKQNRFYCTSLHAHRLVQTEEIPFLSGSRKALFSPAVVEMNATMLLRFLQQNCSRESGTYLLHRAKGGGPVQLYDLQVKCL